jgi:hypothetical protein
MGEVVLQIACIRQFALRVMKAGIRILKEDGKIQSPGVP